MWKKLWYSLYSFARTNLVLCRIHETRAVSNGSNWKTPLPLRAEQRLVGAILFVIRSRFNLTSHKRMNARARAYLRLSQRCECGRKLLHFFLPSYTRRNLPMPGISSQICAALIKDYYRARRHAFFPAFSLSLSLPSPPLLLFRRFLFLRELKAAVTSARSA